MAGTGYGFGARASLLSFSPRYMSYPDPCALRRILAPDKRRREFGAALELVDSAKATNAIRHIQSILPRTLAKAEIAIV